MDEVTSQIGLALVAANWRIELHPRGKDGKFIEKFGLVDLLGLSGFQHGQRGDKKVRGEVADILPNPKDPGNPIIRVKVTDSRWDPKKFGTTVDVSRDQVLQAVKGKATLPTGVPNAPGKKEPIPSPVKTSVAKVAGDLGVATPRVPLPGMTVHPDGPHFEPIEPPGNWDKMTPAERVKFLQDRMVADFTGWRDKPTRFDFTGFDSGLALSMSNAYRDLANWDPDTAQRIDGPILSTAGTGSGLGPNAIAVAHPGTAHPGGIGPKIKDAEMVFGQKYYQSNKFWDQQKAQHGGSKHPWSISSAHGDGTVTLAHEFSHQRQFRFLDVSMRDANKPWSSVVLDDGFGLVPDSSNWPETQALRYAIPKMAPSQYGNSKSSEGFAEAWAGRLTGDSSPELGAVLDQWDEYMGIALALPQDRPTNVKGWDELTAAERDQFWQANGQYLDLPGMREHYPESAAAYDGWVAGKQVSPALSQPLSPTKQADWDTEFGLNPAASWAPGDEGVVPSEFQTAMVEAPASSAPLIRDAGNVYVGDTIQLPGSRMGYRAGPSQVATVTDIKTYPNSDAIRLVTDKGNYDLIHMSDPVTVYPAGSEIPEPGPPPEPPKPIRRHARQQVMAADGVTLTDGVDPGEAEIMQRMLSGTMSTGHQIDVGRVYANPHGWATIIGEVRSPDGNNVGEFKREVRPSPTGWVVKNDLFKLSIGARGQGVGTEITQFFEDYWISHGINRMELFAGDDVGGYAWARAGYRWQEDLEDVENETYLERHQEVIRGIVTRAIRAARSDREAAEAKALLDQAMRASTVSELPSPYELSEIGRQPGDAMWPGKQAMLGSGWHGMKPLPAMAPVAVTAAASLDVLAVIHDGWVLDWADRTPGADDWPPESDARLFHVDLNATAEAMADYDQRLMATS